MFHDLCKENIVLRFPESTGSDGEPIYTECAARAFLFDYSKRLLEEVGIRENTRFFIIAADATVNARFAVCMDGIQAISGGRSYDLKTIKACRQVDGRIECYSCAAF